MKERILDWLRQFRLPDYPGVSTWEECLRVFDDQPATDESDQVGVRLRYALRLFTSANKYLISIMECLGDDAQGVYIICVHANWKEDEQKLQQMVRERYAGSPGGALTAINTVWVQNFRENDIGDALGSCAVAILGNELKGEPPVEHSGQPLKNLFPVTTSFPERE